MYGHGQSLLEVKFSEQVTAKKCLTRSTLRTKHNTKITLIWRRVDDYSLFCLRIQVYLTACLPLHGTEFFPAAALVPWLCPRAVLTWRPLGQLGCQAFFQNKDSFERHPFFVFANMLCCCVQVCTYIMSPQKSLKFLVNKTYLLADRHFSCSSDESRSKHPDCVFLWGTSRGKEYANLKTVPPVRTILPSKHKFAKNFHDITKLLKQSRRE